MKRNSFVSKGKIKMANIAEKEGFAGQGRVLGSKAIKDLSSENLRRMHKEEKEKYDKRKSREELLAKNWEERKRKSDKERA